MELGQKVKSNRHFCGVPLGTEGYCIEDYSTGVMIGWDLPDQPYPKDKTPQEVNDMWAIQHGCPLRDGFDKQEAKDYLDLIN